VRILIVGAGDSSETARWIGLLSGKGWDIHLFPTSEVPPSPALNNVTLWAFLTKRPPWLAKSVRLRGFWPIVPGSRLVPRMMSRIHPLIRARAAWLALLIRWLQPDIIHSLDISDAGHLTLQARDGLRHRLPGWAFPSWLVSGRASEIGPGCCPPHEAGRLKAVLSLADYYCCDSDQEAEAAEAAGFRGRLLWLSHARLRVDPSLFGREQMRRLRQPGPVSARRLIALNGYQSATGRALVGLRAIERCADLLAGYRVGVYFDRHHMTNMSNFAAAEDVRLAARLFSISTGIPTEIEPAEGWQIEQRLRLLGGARVSIGLSLGDATMNSAVEAMIMGAFPIQSAGGSAADWIQDGETGLLVPPEDPEYVEIGLRRALSEDRLVDSAAERNVWLLGDLIAQQPSSRQVAGLYEQIAAEIRQRGLAVAP
jgi:hypothetical protein